jgi:excisionase family DNA binding protein
MQEDKLLTLKELCQLLNLKPASIYSLVYHQKIPVVKLSSRCLRFRLSDIQSWISAKTVQPMQSQAQALPVQPKRPRGRPPKNPRIDQIIEAAKREVMG